MKILLLGGFGYIGSTLTEYLLKNTEHKVTVVDRLDFEINQEFLQDKKVTAEQVKIIQGLLNDSGKSATDICGAYQVEALKDLQETKYDNIDKRLRQILKDKEGKNTTLQNQMINENENN